MEIIFRVARTRRLRRYEVMDPCDCLLVLVHGLISPIRSKRWRGTVLSRGAAATIALLLAPWATPALSSSPRAQAGGNSVTLVSTQFTLVNEKETFQGILSGAPTSTTFLPLNSDPTTALIMHQEQTRHVTISAILGEHGVFPPLASAGDLQDVTPLLKTLKARGFPDSFVKLSMMGSKTKHYYVPFVQATYLLAVNKKALRYLPRGANVYALTYDEWIAWGQSMKRATGKPMIGLPAGPAGLIHRFIQGYLYPSFTHSSGVREFRSAAAVKMWQKVKELWAVTSPQSTSYTSMQQPLLGGSVWVAWDHVARLINAVRRKPNDFLLIPAPSGPAGRGFIQVITGLAIPKGAPNVKGAESLISYLTKPEQQLAVLEKMAFFPATNAKIPSRLPPGIRLEVIAVQKQLLSKRTVPALLPIGLGTHGGDFNLVFIDAFHRIVLDNENIKSVLNDEAETLRGLMKTTGATCWPPDSPSSGPCPVY
jgi:multiple sugar transport system substrate-binding protein